MEQRGGGHGPYTPPAACVVACEMNLHRSNSYEHRQAAFTPSLAQGTSAALAALGLVATTGFGKSAFAHANREETMDTQLTTPEGPGSVSGAPHLPEGFTHTFTSHYI